MPLKIVQPIKECRRIGMVLLINLLTQQSDDQWQREKEDQWEEERRETKGVRRPVGPKEAERRGRPVADRRPEVVEQKKEQKKNEKRMREDRV